MCARSQGQGIGILTGATTFLGTTTATHGAERGVALCRQKTSNLTGPFRRQLLTEEKGELYSDCSGSHFFFVHIRRGVPSLYFQVHHSGTHCAWFPCLFKIKVNLKKIIIIFVACLSFICADSSSHASNRCCALTDDRSLALSHHSVIYGLSFGPR